ncbi:hypothetical protein SNEBB_004716 [Seison nebaliae]|nr:hypothetical protein SNEBB_004716 [Seison nebaliae]
MSRLRSKEFEKICQTNDIPGGSSSKRNHLKRLQESNHRFYSSFMNDVREMYKLIEEIRKNLIVSLRFDGWMNNDRVIDKNEINSTELSQKLYNNLKLLLKKYDMVDVKNGGKKNLNELSSSNQLLQHCQLIYDDLYDYVDDIIDISFKYENYMETDHKLLKNQFRFSNQSKSFDEQFIDELQRKMKKPVKMKNLKNHSSKLGYRIDKDELNERTVEYHEPNERIEKKLIQLQTNRTDQTLRQMLEEGEQIDLTVRNMRKLQQVITEQVVMQSEKLESAQDNLEDANNDMNEGNVLIRKTMQQKISRRFYILIYFIILSIILLILDSPSIILLPLKLLKRSIFFYF